VKPVHRPHPFGVGQNRKDSDLNAGYRPFPHVQTIVRTAIDYFIPKHSLQFTMGRVRWARPVIFFRTPRLTRPMDVAKPPIVTRVSSVFVVNTTNRAKKGVSVIDLGTESLVSLAAACKLPFVMRDDRPLNYSTIIRWYQRGCGGPGGNRVLLETAVIGGRRVTSREAMLRFIASLTATPAPANAIRSPRQRNLAMRAAELATIDL
jgi:hypothetical protein